MLGTGGGGAGDGFVGRLIEMDVRPERLLARRRVHDFVHQAQPGHGVLGVERGRRVGRRDLACVMKFFDSAAPPTSSGMSMPAVMEIAGRDHHLLRALHQQAGQPDRVRAGARG